jgi:anti-anti-sigma factor
MVSPSADYKQFASIREPGPQGEVLHIFGDVDCLSAEEFAVAIEEAITVDEMLIVNLTRCRYMDTTGLSTLVRAKKRFGSSLMVLVKANTLIERLFRMTGLDGVLPVVTELQPREGEGHRYAAKAGTESR